MTLQCEGGTHQFRVPSRYFLKLKKKYHRRGRAIPIGANLLKNGRFFSTFGCFGGRRAMLHSRLRAIIHFYGPSSHINRLLKKSIIAGGEVQ